MGQVLLLSHFIDENIKKITQDHCPLRGKRNKDHYSMNRTFTATMKTATNYDICCVLGAEHGTLHIFTPVWNSQATC